MWLCSSQCGGCGCVVPSIVVWLCVARVHLGGGGGGGEALAPLGGCLPPLKSQ